MSIHDMKQPGDDDGAGGDDVRAAEYVLGVLERTERAEASQRLRGDRAFAYLVAAWERRFSRWREAYPRVAPPPEVWTIVCERLAFGSAPPTTEATIAWWNRATPWRIAAGIAAAIALFALIGPRVRPPAPPVAPPVAVAPERTPEAEVAKPVAVLRLADGSVGWLASLDRASGKVLMVPVPTPADPAGKVDELWLRGDHGDPVSLGFVSNEKAHTIVVPPAARDRLALGSVLSVSREDKAGIPHRLQSDRLVASGAIETL